MNKNLLLLSLAFVLLITKESYSNTCTSIAGTFPSWAVMGWTCVSAPTSGPPTCGDVMNIGAGTNVSISEGVDYSACATPITLNIYGTMTFPDGGVRFKLPVGSTVFVASGGKIDLTFVGGGSSALISVGGQNVWTAGMGDITGPTVLPIQLISFTAKALRTSVKLEWSTATEINNDLFIVEKATDGSNFELVATTDAAGNSSSIMNYSVEDINPTAGTSYYRLKQIDYNGDFTYFKTIAISYHNFVDFSLNVFPNPNSGSKLNISFNTEESSTIQVNIYDAMGKLAFSEAINANTGKNDHAVDLESNLSTGIYMVKAVSGENGYSKRLIVQ